MLLATHLVLGIVVLAVTLHVLADGHSFLDEEIEVLRELRSQSVSLKDAEHLKIRHWEVDGLARSMGELPCFRSRW